MIDTKALRSRVLDLAIRGKLTEQLESDGTAEELYQQIQTEKPKLKKEKPLPPIKSDETPFEIPSNWKWIKFSNIIALQSGQDLTKDEYNDKSAGIPYMTGASNYNDDGSLIINRWTETPKALAENGDILLSCKGTVGKIAILSIDKVHIARQIMGIRVFIADNSYVSLFVKSAVNGIIAASKGLIPGIERKDVLNLNIPLPPLAEQKRIVERVEEIFRLLDTIDEAQEKYSADAESLKAKLITAGIQGKLTKQLPSDGTAEELYQQIQAEKQKLIKEGKLKKEKPLPVIKDEEIPFEIPENWKWVRLSELTGKITSGSTPAGGKKGNAYVNEGYCFFREQNIYNDGIHTDGMVYISEELLKTRENSTVLPNDILLNITGGSIGRCAIIPDDFSKGSINQHILIIRLVEKEMLNYIHNLLCSPYYQGIIQSKVVGDKDGFSGGRCKATLIPLPPLAEQKRIAEVLERVLWALSLQ